MRRIRVLIVDDSVVIRRALSNLVEGDPSLALAGVAANGRIALAKIPKIEPDIVVLDVDMPVMDGLETLTELRRLYPKLPVIMFSALTERGAEATLDALFRGALDYVTKPAQLGSAEQAESAAREQLIPKIKSLCAPRTAARRRIPRPTRSLLSPQTSRPSGPVRAVVIASSTGGPPVLEKLLTGLPKPIPVPVLVVQHMPPLFTKNLARQLAAKSGLPVFEGRPGAPVAPGTVWIAPGGNHLAVEIRDEHVRLVTNTAPPENSCRPSADVLFRAASNVWGDGVLAIVLTGMGQDGLRGCGAIKAAGGRVAAQDRATSVVWGMPGFVVDSGLADAVLPAGELASWVTRELKRPASKRRNVGRRGRRT